MSRGFECGEQKLVKVEIVHICVIHTDITQNSSYMFNTHGNHTNIIPKLPTL
jgi:hypothetical protein